MTDISPPLWGRRQWHPINPRRYADSDRDRVLATAERVREVQGDEILSRLSWTPWGNERQYRAASRSHVYLDGWALCGTQPPFDRLDIEMHPSTRPLCGDCADRCFMFQMTLAGMLGYHVQKDGSGFMGNDGALHIWGRRSYKGRRIVR